MPTDSELLAAGVAPEAVATLAADRPAFQANQLATELDKLGDPVVSLEDADVAVAAPSAPQELNAQLASSGDQEVDPLDVFPDEALISDRSFSPKEEYIRRGGAAAFDAKSAARLGKIRKGQEANRTVLGTAAAQVKEIIPQVGRVIKGVGQGIASGLNVFTAPAVAAVTSNETGVEFSNLVEQQAAESLHGVVAETAGLAKGIGSLGKYVSRKTGLSKDWSDMTDEEAFRAIIDEGEKEREVRSMSQGNIPALEPTRARLAEEGFPVRPEKVQEATEMGTLGWLAFGTALKLGGAGVSKAVSGAGKLVPASVLSAAQKVEQLAALRVAKDAALAAQKAGPKNAATEAALRTAQESFQAAEKAVSESNLAGAIDFANRARSAISSASETLGQGIVGRPIQLVGAAVEGLVKLTDKTTRSLGALGKAASFFHNPIGTLFALAGKEVAAPLIQKAGAAAKGYGKAVAEGQARRTLDVLGAAKDVATTSLSQYPMDYAFSIGLSDTDQEARVSAPISTALGVFPGARRGISRIVTGELITPKGTPAFKPSPAYGENKVLDATHATAMKTVDAKSAAQINWVRELARKMGGRVYLMPDTATFESALGEVWKQQNPGAEVTPAIAAQIKQAADQQGMAFGEFIAADGELQPTVFIKNPDAATHEMGHILEKVLPEQVNSRLDEQILNRLSPENIEAAGTEYVRRLGEAGAPWREVLQRLNPELSPEQYLARELRAENLGVALQNRGEAFATSPGLYRWLAQTVAKIGDVQGIPLAQSEALGFPVFGDVMRASEKAAEKILGDEAGQELIQARDTRLKAATPTEVKQWSKLPETTAEGAAEADKVEAWLQTASIPVASRAAAAATLAEAMRNQQGVRLSYWGAKGEPGGDPAALRPERRAEIEAQRDAPNADRPLVTKDYFPYGAIITSKGPQFKGWSPNNFNANAARFAEWITANPEAARRLPLAHDLSTEAGQRGLQADLQTFVQNQQAGFTGSGRELIIPPESGATQPVKTGVEPVSLPQERADAVSYLFNLKLPETPRITSGKLPLNIVGQMVSETTLPGRVAEPIRPRGAFIGPKAEALNIAGETVREVNPFRQAVEQAAKEAGTKPPELIEAAQILALDRIADATVAPELPAFGGNVVTLTAGFLPGESKSARVVGEEILRMTPEEFSTATRGWVGGLTGEARKMGLNLKSPEELSALRQFVTDAQATSKAAMARKDFDTAMAEVSKVQMFNEAIQSATGTGSNGEALRAALGADYKPPFPEGGAEAAQFLPKPPKLEYVLERELTSEELRQLGAELSKFTPEEQKRLARSLPSKGSEGREEWRDEYGFQRGTIKFTGLEDASRTEKEKAFDALNAAKDKKFEELQRHSGGGKEKSRLADEYVELSRDSEMARQELENLTTRTEKFGVPVEYESAPEIPAKEIQIPDEYSDYITSGPAWVLPDGRGFHVSNGTFYHDDFAKGLADLNRFGEMDATEFQSRAGAMRLATPDSMRTLMDTGGGSLAVSVTLKPTEGQLRVLREYLSDAAGDGTPLYSSIVTEVLNAKGEHIASKEFENLGKITAGQVSRFLKNPTAEAAPVTTQALPRKPKNEFKLLPAGTAGSKAWVLPGGKVEQLGGQWHHEWLDKNKAVQEKYGLEVPAFEGGDAEMVRESALKKGFVRVNYSRNTGTLTVEARAKDWRKQKGAVERLIEENIDDIDNVTVHLMDESVQKVVDSASERLFSYDSDMEKLANLPFITKGEVRGGSQFLPEGTPKERVEDLKSRGLFVGDRLPEGFFKEAVAAWNYWLSPDGDVFPILGETMMHDSWARENIVGADLTGKILNVVPVARDLGPSRYAAQARKLGWTQVYVEPMTGNKGIYVEGKLNSSQKAILEDLAFDKKLSVRDRNTDRLLISSTSEFGGSQFLPKEEASEGIRGLARGYAESAGIDYAPRTTFPAINETLAKKLADFYESAESKPDDPAVQKSYQALADETMAQYRTMEEAGYTIEPWTGKGEPYKNSAEAVTDARENKHLYFLQTEKQFGAGESNQSNPMLADSGVVIDGKSLPVNDVFRAVHDFFGHAKEGYQFGPRGEFNAWNAHSEMFSPEAQGALAAETLAQNSWVNFGPQLRNEAGVIPKKGEAGYKSLAERPFGEQKNVLVPDELIAEAKAQFLPVEQAGLPGITSGREFDRKAIEGMSQAQLKEYFPEAVIPKKNTEYIPAEIVNSPLAKAAGSREAAVQAFADKLVQFYRQREDTPGSQAGAKWYSEFTPLLKKEFGKDSRIFAELLAATSPNNTPKINFAFSLDAFQNWKAGKYDKMISKFNEGLNKLSDGGLEKVYQRDLKAGKVKKPPEKPSDATYLAHWIDKNDLIPRGSSGARFSMHSVPVLKVLARKWLELNTGLKTDNFIKNLVGEGDEATVDVWADRTMRRLGYEGFKDRWRILPRNKAPVRDADFIFSQEAFRKAAEEIGIKPSALQGALWFAEKQYWNEQGWARLDLGDYKSELERMPQLRAGFKSREASAKVKADESQKELEILPRQALPAESAQLSVAHRVASRGASGLGGIGGSYATDGSDEKELEISPR